jgi:hypothetical protein
MDGYLLFNSTEFNVLIMHEHVMQKTGLLMHFESAKYQTLSLLIYLWF